MFRSVTFKQGCSESNRLEGRFDSGLELYPQKT
jgi:hypothetical protein